MNVLSSIGNTPLVKLKKINPYDHIDIYAKLEYFNPSGSIKDRIVSHILAEAEKTGELGPDSVIVENTSGNTGAAAAMMGALRGLRTILTMPDKVSIEKQNALKAFGAEIVVTPTNVEHDDPQNYVQTALRIAAETPNSFRINQYDNQKNPEAHYLSTGPEIWEQTGGKVTHFVAAGSTGGTITGTSRFLKERNPNIVTMLPDPIGSIYHHYHQTGEILTGGSCSYFVEGVGEDHIVGAIDFDVIDQTIQFNDQNAFSMCRQLAEKEGIFAGGTGGANVWGALQLAATLKEPATIVTVIPDNGVKYMSKIYNNDWMKANNFDI